MELGVQTHFSQGWNQTFLDRLAALGIDNIRDSLPWGQVEKSEGNFEFPTALANYMDKTGDLNVDTLLTFASSNTLYDSGLTPYTAEGRQAYADYIVKVLQTYGDQVNSIEIWNEFNVGNFKGPASSDPSFYYTELLKTVWQTVKPLFPAVEILGGSTNVIGTGALGTIFKLGALDYMDAVAVHPYRNTPEHVDDEISHLRDVMASYGSIKPILATEFGNQFKEATDAPDFMLKMVTLMASADVSAAYWYSLIDEKFYPNMGLLTSKGEEKPAASAFEFIQKYLLPLGTPEKISTGDDITEIYRFGSDTYVMWSSGRDISFSYGGQIYDSTGHLTTTPGTLSMQPIIFKGPGFSLGHSDIVADSLMQFGGAAWEYFAKVANGSMIELVNVDNNWTSYLGSNYTKPLRVNADSIAPAGDGANPIQVVERYTSTKKQTVAVDGHWMTGAGDGVDLHILLNGKEIFTTLFAGSYDLSDYLVHLEDGDTLDFALGPNQYVTGDSTARRIVLRAVDGAGPHASSETSGAELPQLRAQNGKIGGSDASEILTALSLIQDKDQVVTLRGGDDTFDFSNLSRSHEHLNAVLDLGSGNDTIIFEHALDHYSFKIRSDGGIKIQDIEDRDAITVRNAELFRFAGSDVSTPHEFVYAELLHHIASASV